MKLSSSMVSWFWLAVLFWRQVFRSLWRREGEGLARFKENYFKEALLPVPASHSTAAVQFARCVCCGLCDSEMFGTESGLHSRSGPPRHEYPSVTMMAASLIRSMPEFRNGAAYIRHLAVWADVKSVRNICPFNIAVAEEAELIRSYLDSLAREDKRGG